MNKRERVVAAIRGQKTECIPTCFSLHFREEQKFGEEAVKAHLDFFEKTDTDVIKIMNENQVPNMGDIRCAEEFAKYRKMDVSESFIQDQLKMTRTILKYADPEAFSVGTLHGIVASMIHPLEKAGRTSIESRFFLRDSLRQNEQPVLEAMRRVSDIMCDLAREYIHCGLDGVYYAALGGERRIFTDEEFERWIKPFDLKIMKAVKDVGGYCILHICKDEVNMERFQPHMEYTDIVNWGVYEAPYSLQDGKKLFSGKTIMGGLANRSGVMVEGTIEELQNEVKKIVTEFGREGFIMGADCTLPTDIDAERVRAIVDVCREI